MSYSTKEGVLKVGGVEVVDFVLDHDFSTDPLEVRNTRFGEIVASWTDANAVDATLLFEIALAVEGPWIGVESGTVGSPEGFATPKFPNALYPYIRMTATANSETAAKVTARFHFRG